MEVNAFEHNPGWGDYIGRVVAVGLDLSVKCTDDGKVIKMDKSKFRQTPTHTH